MWEHSIPMPLRVVPVEESRIQCDFPYGSTSLPWAVMAEAEASVRIYQEINKPSDGKVLHMQPRQATNGWTYLTVCCLQHSCTCSILSHENIIRHQSGMMKPGVAVAVWSFSDFLRLLWWTVLSRNGILCHAKCVTSSHKAWPQANWRNPCRRM